MIQTANTAFPYVFVLVGNTHFGIVTAEEKLWGRSRRVPLPNSVRWGNRLLQLLRIAGLDGKK